jgi:hypothetical protein
LNAAASDGAAVIQHLRTDIAAALDKADDNRVMGLAAKASRTLGLAGPGQFGFVGFNGLARTAKLLRQARGHGVTDTVPKVPSRLHTAAKKPLKLAGGDAFLAAAKQVDGLKPQPQGKVAVLKNRPDAHRKGLPTGVALAQTNPGRLALKASDFARIGVFTVRADRTIGPKLRFDVSESRFLVVKPSVGKDRLGHDLSPMAKILDMGPGYVK